MCARVCVCVCTSAFKMWFQSNKSFIDPQSLHFCLSRSRLICIYINIFNWETTQPSKSTFGSAFDSVCLPTHKKKITPAFSLSLPRFHIQSVLSMAKENQPHWIVNKQQQIQHECSMKEKKVAMAASVAMEQHIKNSKKVYWLERVPVTVTTAVVLQPQAFIGNANDCFRFH